MITYKCVKLADLNDTFLEKFDRHQVTREVWFKETNHLVTRPDTFIDDWDSEKKAQVIKELCTCLMQGGVVIGAYNDENLVGFACIENQLFGSKNEYIELPYIHVTRNSRGFGIGKNLLIKCCEEAKKLGAKKLYIAAHPSIESQAFYRAMGCKEAVEINPIILAKEPLDIQLEKSV